MDSTNMLLIVYKNGNTRYIGNVKNYGVVEAHDHVFYVEKNGQRSYIPAYNVIYFGNPENWRN